jgi:chaperonin cofactor prefoldin
MEQLEQVLEALKSARTELEALEADTDWYCTTGNLIEQLEEAEAIVEQEIDK